MDRSVHISLAEEKLDVSVKEKMTESVRVRTTTEVIEDLAVAELERSTVKVLHVPIDRFVDAAPEIRVEGDVTIIPVLEEVLVVEKRLVLKEEVHLVRSTTVEKAEIPVALRKQKAVVERVQSTDEAIKGNDNADSV